MSLFIEYRALSIEELPLNRRPFYEPIVYNYNNSDKGILILDVYAIPIINGISIPFDLSLQELETTCELEGDFKYQFPPDTGHNPQEEFIRIDKIVDEISFALDTEKPCENGSARWTIPILLESGTNPLWLPNKIDVVQEYILADRHLTILKGGCVLLQCPIDKP